jgi:hypothetical protein
MTADVQEPNVEAPSGEEPTILFCSLPLFSSPVISVALLKARALIKCLNTNLMNKLLLQLISNLFLLCMFSCPFGWRQCRIGATLEELDMYLISSVLFMCDHFAVVGS